MVDIEFLNQEHERALAMLAEPPVARWCKFQRRLTQAGTVSVMGNAYGASFIHDFQGLPVEVRIDPLRPDAGAEVFTASGKFLGLADLVAAKKPSTGGPR